MLNLCSDNHEEICYEGKECPICKQIEELQTEISNLESDLEKVQQENDDLSLQLNSINKE